MGENEVMPLVDVVENVRRRFPCVFISAQGASQISGIGGPDADLEGSRMGMLQ